MSIRWRWYMVNASLLLLHITWWKLFGVNYTTSFWHKLSTNNMLVVIYACVYISKPYIIHKCFHQLKKHFFKFWLKLWILHCVLKAWTTFMWMYFNSLWPNDAIWRRRSGSTLAQVMACCLTALSHYMNTWWFTISKVHWHSFEYNFTRDTSAINH